MKTVDYKRIFRPLMCVGMGVLHLILLFFNYSATFVAGSGMGDWLAYGFSGYNCSAFGSKSAVHLLKGADLSFFLTLGTIAMLLLLILSIALILWGVIGLVKEFAKVDLLGGLAQSKVNDITRLSVKIYFILTIVAAVLFFIFDIFNIESGFGITAGMRPGIGMIFLLALAIVAKILYPRFEKKFSVADIPEAPVAPVAPAETDGEASEADAPEAPVAAESADEVKTIGWTALFGKIKEFFAKKNIPMKTVAIVGAALAAVIVVIIVLCAIPWAKSPDYMIPDKYLGCVYDAEEDKTLVFCDNELLDYTLDGAYDEYELSLDGDTLVILMEEEDTLYVCTAKESHKVSSEVESYRLSMNGDALVYINADGELMYFATGDEGKGERVTDELAEDAICFSPDGETIAYATGDGEDVTTYVWSDGEAEKLKSGVYPIGISNDADTVCYYDLEKDAVYMRSGKEDVKILSDASLVGYTLVYNADHTQIILAQSSGECYFVDDEGEKTKLTSNSMKQFGSYDLSKEYRSGRNAMTLPIYDFEGQYFVDGSANLYHLDKGLDPVKVESGVSSFKAARKQDVLYYRDYSGSLYRLTDPDGKGEKIADYAHAYVVSANGKFCYYADAEGTLYCVKKTGDPDKIADDVESLWITHDDYVYFMEEDGTLYVSHKGSDRERVAEDVTDATVCATVIYYAVEEDDEMTVYAAAKKDKFEAIIKDLAK